MSTPPPRPEKIIEALAVLELPPEATATEVRQSYRFLRDLYGGESMVTLPISSEISQTEREKILGEIEAAYDRLARFFDAERSKAQQKQGPLPAEVEQLLSGTGEVTGEVLRTVRTMRGYRIGEVSAETRIPAEHLASIEAEAFADLPPVVYTRGFVAGYAAFLEIDAQRAASDFMRRLARWENRPRRHPSRRKFRLAFWRR